MKKFMAFAGAMMVASSLSVARAEMKFVDVPSGHWAYDAIEYATKVGCWEGYPDGTFRGNRNITRYEMAMLIERIIKTCVKGGGAETDEKALGEIEKLKALIDKLEAEFKDELAALKTRVDDAEEDIDWLKKDQKRQDKEIGRLADLIGNVKVSGTLRSRIDTFGSDINTRYLAANPGIAADKIVGGAVGATGVETEYGYELFYDVIFESTVGEMTDVVVEFNNWAGDLRYGSRTGADRTPVVDQAYASIDFTGKTQSLDNLRVTLGNQYYSFGPHHLLVDNGWESHPTVRMDVSKDVVDFTVLASVINQDVAGGYAAANPVRAGLGQDALGALRLGLNLKPAKLGVNYLGSGTEKERGWGVDLESPLLRNTNWFNGISGEFIQMIDDQTGRDPDVSTAAASEDMDNSWMVALDVYKSKRTLVNAYYADIGLVPGWSGAISNPFAEFNTYAQMVGTTWGYQLDPFLFDNYHQIAPDFEGFGAKVVHSFSHDVTVAAIGRKGDWNTVANAEHPPYGAVRVSKGITDDTTFAIDYSQYGFDDILLNRVRGELVVNF